jgi:hypothetical protein
MRSLKRLPGWSKTALLCASIPLSLALGLAAVAIPQAAAPKAVSEDDARLFETKVRPLLFDKCFSCHGDEKQMGGLRMDTEAGLRKGAASGAVLAADPEQSRLIRAVHYDGAVKMPPTGKLKPEEIALLTDWVKRGAPWPHAKVSYPTTPDMQLTPAQKKFWSFQPVKNSPIPKVKSRAGVQPIDAFILAELEKKGLALSPAADRRTLIRRATFDVTGLPPTPEEINAFLADKSPDAYAKVVDRLLASPRYGERWGRHWLDLVRYCDSLDARGLGSDGDVQNAWRYRDWVIDALNSDMPYSDFLMNQIAGDLMTQGKPGGFNRAGTIATGMLAIGNWGNGDADKEKIYTDIVDDQIDVVSRGFLGLTVACARCHNHKFDPISTKDYYGLAGIFFSTHILGKFTPKGQGELPMHIPLLSAEDVAKRNQHAARVAELEKGLKSASDEQYALYAHSMLPQTADYLTAAWEYQHRPADQAGVTLAAFAAQRHLQEYAVRQWIDSMGMGVYKLMTIPVANVLGAPGIHAFRGAPDTPSLSVNTTIEAKMLLTFNLPPRSVSVHPGPASGVAVSWRSPISGTVKVTGRVADGDPAGGDGIAWVLAHRTGGGAKELASGGFENGGMQGFSEGKGAANLQTVTVKAGERIELQVLPKTSHTCDTTTVTLVINEVGGTRKWDLTHDIVDNLHQGGNPHKDSYGNSGVWSFEDMDNAGKLFRPEGAAGLAFAKWQEVAGKEGVTREAVVAASKEVQQVFSVADARSPFWINSPGDQGALPVPAREKLAKLSGELDSLRKNMPPPIEYAEGAQDGGIPETDYAGFHDARVHIRGNYARLSDLVTRRFPVIVAGDKQPPITNGSGRLELARWVSSDTNPLTARVIVNRIWQHHFGEGIVRTPSNFGFLGERPTHPELLDYLAAQFVKNGWSQKKLHRMILLSATYQQTSEPSKQAERLDPDNRLLSRMNRKRLEAEAIRDNLLFAAGKLDIKMGGPAERDFNKPRRTVYIVTIRSDRTGFGPLFDMADSTAQVDRRTSSTVAPQALYLMNSPFALEQTKALAKRILTEVQGTDSARIHRLYGLLYGREASPEEMKIGLDYLSHARRSRSARVAGPGAPDMEMAAWVQYCQILLCANEFLYVD